MQACVAAPNTPTPSSQPDQYSDRFSVEKIKQRREAEYAQKLADLNKMNPANEVQKAVNNNSIYLLAYQTGKGGSTQIPGLNEQQTSNIKCRVLQLDGMGDAIYGENHLKYRAAIQKYASQFNVAMYPNCR